MDYNEAGPTRKFWCFKSTYIPVTTHFNIIDSIIDDHMKKKNNCTGDDEKDMVDELLAFYNDEDAKLVAESEDLHGGIKLSRNNIKAIIMVGCGAWNTIFPLIAAYPKLFVYSCDFSSDALALVKSHSKFNEDRIHLFNCDVSSEELCDKILPCSIDIVTLVFTLSAVSPNKMSFVLQNLKKVIKPNGHILVRDYAVGDSTQGL